MPESSDLNDLYQEWLEIPADRLPPNHYALLGLDDFESDESRIDVAAKSRSAYLHQIAAGPQRKIVQEMLGQVAIARRTLMRSESRERYNESLSADGGLLAHPAGDVSKLDAGNVGSPADDALSAPADSISRQNSTPVRRRSRASDWKYHAVSAAVLLSIVGIVYFVNRNPGGRKAAQARSDDTNQASGISADTGAGGATNDVSDSGPVRKANPRIASVRSSNQAASKRPSPIAKRRDTGSGLGSEMGDKFADVLSEIANQPSNPNSTDGAQSGDKDQFRPLGGLLIGDVVASVEPGAWPDLLAAVSEFPSEMSKRYQCERGFKWYDVDGDKLVVKSNDRGNVFQLSDKQFAMTAGAAVSLTSSLVAKMRSDMQVGMEIDHVRVGIRPSQKGVQVYARGRGSDAGVEVLAELKTTSKPTTLTITRDSDDSDLIRWFAKSADQSFTGTIGVRSLVGIPETTIYVAAPKQKTKQRFWISNLMIRSGS